MVEEIGGNVADLDDANGVSASPEFFDRLDTRFDGDLFEAAVLTEDFFWVVGGEV